MPEVDSGQFHLRVPPHEATRILRQQTAKLQTILAVPHKTEEQLAVARHVVVHWWSETLGVTEKVFASENQRSAFLEATAGLEAVPQTPSNFVELAAVLGSAVKLIGKWLQQLSALERNARDPERSARGTSSVAPANEEKIETLNKWFSDATQDAKSPTASAASFA